MKKFVSLILALALTLVAVSAFAASSKTVSDTSSSTVVDDTTVVTPAVAISTILTEDSEDTIALKAALAADGVAALPEDVQAQIPEGLAAINEVVTYLLDNVDGMKTLTVNYGFTTLYAPAGEKVALIFVIPTADGYEYVVVEGTIQENGSINATLNEEQIAQIAGKVVTLIVVSK